MLTSKNQVESIAFVDGVCDIYTIDGRQAKTKTGTFNYKESTVGIKSYYGFQTLGVEIEKVISIPYNTLVNKSKIVKIGDDTYQITLIQPKDTFPKSLKLTLSKSSIKWGRTND